jgi:hypothetical protein
MYQCTTVRKVEQSSGRLGRQGNLFRPNYMSLCSIFGTV